VSTLHRLFGIRDFILRVLTVVPPIRVRVPASAFFFNLEVLNHVEDHVFNLISVFFDRDEMLLLT
jgi:hypothetical protein